MTLATPTWDTLDRLAKTHGAPIYLLDTQAFESNYDELLAAFREFYPKTNIGYSYKTNYTPDICRIVDRKGGYAEVVSDMELEVATSIGVSMRRVIYNGPVKDADSIGRCLLGGGTVNLDAAYEVPIVETIARENPDQTLSVGIRCNFAIDDKLYSRFGFDVESPEFKDAVRRLQALPNVRLGLHSHFPNRDLESYVQRTERMLKLSSETFSKPPAFLDLGGGFFGKIPEALASQLSVKVAAYRDYASVVAARFQSFFADLSEEERPQLIIEPGTALVGDAMRFVARVVSVKEVRGKTVATVTGSKLNFLPMAANLNLPLEVVRRTPGAEADGQGKTVDIAGHTCIEADYLCRGYVGHIEEGDFVVLRNTGSYSIVMKPPFIFPNGAILAMRPKDASFHVVRRKERTNDLFSLFSSWNPEASHEP